MGAPLSLVTSHSYGRLMHVSTGSLESVGGSVPALISVFLLQTAPKFVLEWHHLVEGKLSVVMAS